MRLMTASSSALHVSKHIYQELLHDALTIGIIAIACCSILSVGVISAIPLSLIVLSIGCCIGSLVSCTGSCVSWLCAWGSLLSARRGLRHVPPGPVGPV